MKLTIVGSGDAFCAGGRNQTCLLLDHAGHRLMIDCGATTLLALKRARIPLDSVDRILLSHLHGDHFGGLPFLFINAVFIDKRTKPLPILGPPTLRQRIETLIETCYPDALSNKRAFEMTFHEVEPGVPVRDIPGMTIHPVEMLHASGAPSLGFRIEADGKTLAFSGDTGWCEGVFEAGRGADLYIVECSTYALKLKMHLDYETLAGRFDEIGAKKYLLTHMSEDMLAKGHRIDWDRCMMAEDGLVIEV